MATVLTEAEEEAAARAERVRVLASFYADDLARHDAEMTAAILREMAARLPIPLRKELLRQIAADMLTAERAGASHRRVR